MALDFDHITASALGAGDATPLEDLLDLVGKGRPAWQADALCAEPRYGTGRFFPRGYTPSFEPEVEAARELCRRCLVTAECLAHALDHEEAAGIWGGTTPAQRRAMRKGTRGRPRGRRGGVRT